MANGHIMRRSFFVIVGITSLSNFSIQVAIQEEKKTASS